MQSRNGHALFYSVADPNLYKKLKTWLPERNPALNFAFLGGTFSDWSRWRPGHKKNLPPTTRLLSRWVLMDLHTVTVIRPALESAEHDIVVVNEFGRDAYLYAVKYGDCTQALCFHKVLVNARILGQGVPPPEYIAEPPNDPRLRSADEEYFSDPAQKIHYLNPGTLEAHCTAVNKILREGLAARKRNIAA